ncbi:MULTISPECIES: hypothetical protein [unclassified Leucobacter]|uniref:hypothetical protein n=1 Tax=unclassified Leucobacter TaxID=2621730 RepID=UPI003016888B
MTRIDDTMLLAAAEEFALRGYHSAQLNWMLAGDVDALAGRPPTRHELGVAVLNAEGTAMRGAQAAAARRASSPLERLYCAFDEVGELMAGNVLVRAGMRLAAESRTEFPERRIDPYATWHTFLTGALTEAAAAGELRPDTNIDEVAWTLVAVGFGTKDLVGFHGRWEEVGPRLHAALHYVLGSVVPQR